MTEDTSPLTGYIYIPHWDAFQHYKKGDRRPVWIKLHIELLDHEEFCSLTFAQRGVLMQLWILAARMGNGRIPADVQRLSSLLSAQHGGDSSHLAATIRRLNHAGLIEVHASKALATRYHAASTEGLLRKPIRGGAVSASADAAPQNGDPPHLGDAELAARLAQIQAEQRGEPAP